jgi:nucleoid-associated protein YgaU
VVVAGVQRAVLEFDDAVQVPWRPRLRAVPALDGPGAQSSPRSAVARPASSRAGVARPSQAGGLRTGAVGGARPGGTGPARPVPAGVAPSAPGRPVRGGCVQAGRRTRPGLRLTRRARRLSVVLALGVGLALGSWLAPLLGGESSDLRLVGERSVVVQSGQTVWSIADDVAGDGQDVRAVVDAIEELNGLDGAVVIPGQVLRLP